MLKNTIPYLIAFFSGLAMMSYEILGVRVLSPSFGGSVYVWGAIIAVFLSGLGIGYALGGRMADRFPAGVLLRRILLVPTVLILGFPLYGHLLCRMIYGWELDSRLGALLVSFNLFFLPCLFIGMVLPVLVKMRAAATGKIGSAAGNISAVSTAGSIVGTLFTSFFLLAWVSVTVGVVLTGGVLGLCWLLAWRADDL